MTMKAVFIFATIFALTTATMPSHAEVFQWKDANGQTVVSDAPPPSSAKDKRSIGGVRPSVVSESIPEKSAEAAKVADAPKTTAEKDLDFKKRQQDAKEKAEKQAKQQAADSEKRDNCERAKRNLSVLESNRPVTSYDESGERKLMDTAQRDQEMERTRKIMSESCK